VVKRNYSSENRGEVKGKKRGKAKEKREQKKRKKLGNKGFLTKTLKMGPLAIDKDVIL